MAEHIADRFRFRPATSATVPVFEEVRALFTNLAEELDELLPAGREKAVAFTELETAHFWANAAIARGSDQ
ncbi:Acb2/Tad1 domain-containing protein [Blastococcus mobilis]|uniref:Acb2/Tad1 hairpin domain-containing protein n=1 Tax=Blastococcus mobilis TaxID=1938746 RepID=A0A238VXF5_9ACTN|nr:hypothetical protein [Blastococcus mobilis]SNR38976.1 hypothetical protein SAMN06272737_105141 [Blastococcus mobilis]